MPFTPFHLALPFAIYTFLTIINKFTRSTNISKYSVFSLFFGSVAPDIQGFISIFFNDNISLHGFSHTILGGFTYSLIYGALLLSIRKYLDIRIQKQMVIIFFSIIFFHIVPDSFIYPEMQVFWPIKTGSIGNHNNYSVVTDILIKIGLFALITQFAYIIVKLVKLTQ